MIQEVQKDRTLIYEGSYFVLEIFQLSNCVYVYVFKLQAAVGSLIGPKFLLQFFLATTGQTKGNFRQPLGQPRGNQEATYIGAK